MIYEYYESKKSTRKTVPIENIIENFMSEIKNHLEQKNFTQAYNMINRMRWTIKQKTNSEAINDPMIQEKIKEIIKEWQEQFPGNKREIDLRLWLLRYGKNLIPEGLSINS